MGVIEGLVSSDHAERNFRATKVEFWREKSTQNPFGHQTLRLKAIRKVEPALSTYFSRRRISSGSGLYLS